MAAVGGLGVVAATTGFRVLFNQGFMAAKPVWPEFCVEATSEGAAETYFFPDHLHEMREWDGPREEKNLKFAELEVTNKSYELTVSVSKNDWEDGRLLGYSQNFVQLGLAAKMNPDRLLGSLLRGAFTTTLSYDGQPLCGSHPLASGAYSNKGTAALDQEAFEAALAQMHGVKSYFGARVDIFAMGGKLKLIVPPALRAAALSIVGVQKLASGADNPNYGAADVQVYNQLADTPAYWFLALGGAPVRPFIRQVRRPYQLVAMTKEDDEAVFTSGKLRWGVDGREAVAAGEWRVIYGSDGTT